MPQADSRFKQDVHGYAFSNRFEFNFEFELPLVGNIDLGDLVYGLCGGMCFSALDYFHAGLPIPSRERRPQFGTALYKLLVDRQLDSMAIPRGILKVLEWMIRDDKDVWRKTAWNEFPKLRRRLDNRLPVVLALIRAGGIDDPTKNHQVVARAYIYDESSRDAQVFLYDPNHPGREPILTMNLSRPSSGISAAQSTGESFRGFFVLKYRPQDPGHAYGT